MDKLPLIKTVISIILSLSIAHILKGIAYFIQHPGRYRLYWVHLLWVTYTFIMLLDFWWFESRLSKVSIWNFLSYSFVIFYILLLYLLCAILLPQDLDEYDKKFKSYFFLRKKWIFGILALIFLVDIVDTLIKGVGYWRSFGVEYQIKTVSHVALFLMAMKISKEWFHAALVVFMIAYELFWIWRFQFTL